MPSSDPISFEYTYRALPGLLHRQATLASYPEPQLVKLNEDLATELGLDIAFLKSPEGVTMLAGNAMPEGASPVALAYAGHQFGNWVPQLGDGRAMLVGEIVAPDGQRFDLHLKGSGRTEFSRGGDGKAALGPVIREYILCEAMHALGVPTTRALAAVTTGETVAREVPLAGGVFARIAASHIRVGTFQYVYARDELDVLKALADHAIDRHHPQARSKDNPYRALLEIVITTQARLIAKWMGIGFIHGVMNTDNMTISGETIDYGPCAFMDAYNPGQVYSSIDQFGRYAYGNQPQIGQWNLANLAQSLLPLLDEDEQKAISAAQAALDIYPSAFETAYLDVLRAKLGLAEKREGDFALAQDLLKRMADGHADFTRTFRTLSNLENDESEAFTSLFDDPASADMWLLAWRSRLQKEQRSDADRMVAMQATNPVYIPRNHLVEEAIQAAYACDYSVFEALNAVLAHPFNEQPGQERYALPPNPGEEVLQTFCGT